MAGGISFNVAFGINETPLTSALESRNYAKALEYIDSRYGVCLDEGFYQRTPLYIVLSREKSRYDGEAMPIHLKIARRLIERGADPNLRVPETCGAEYISPGKSPLECIVELYNTLTRQTSTTQKENQMGEAISASGDIDSTKVELIEELIDMTWFLLGHGADVNVRDSENKTPLHSTLLLSDDLRLAQTLCDNFADINAVDCFGNTPLMAVCSPLPWKQDNYYGPCVDGTYLVEKVQYLLSFDNLEINHRGLRERTALFYSMLCGNFQVAKMLLQKGANPSIKGMGPGGRYISPLLAALIPWNSQSPGDANASARELAELVDNGHFSTQEIRDEMLEYGEEGLSRLRFQGNQLVKNLFGNRVALTQLASRTLVNSWFPGEEFRCLSEDEVADVVHSRGIPSEVLTEFQVILLKHKILKSIRETDWDLWAMDEFSLSDSDEYDESDDEYW